jgi:hypothetical protein
MGTIHTPWQVACCSVLRQAEPLPTDKHVAHCMVPAKKQDKSSDPLMLFAHDAAVCRRGWAVFTTVNDNGDSVFGCRQCPPASIASGGEFATADTECTPCPAGRTTTN